MEAEIPMSMKTKYLIPMTIAGVAATAISLAQPPPPLDPRGPGGAPPPPVAATQQVTGTVSQYLMNPNGEVDGMLLSDNTQVKFPPHMSADLTRAVRPNDRITASGEPEGAQTFHAFTIINANGQSVNEARPSQPPPPPDLRGVNLQPMSASGRIKSLLHAPRGEVDGAVLDDGTILHVRPDASAQFSSLLAIGQSISANGFGTANSFGKSIEVSAIGAVGQALTPIYAAAPPPPR
jgi:hypothetical protein